MTIETGQIAPDFTLFASDKKEFTLSSLRGKNVVLLFIPAAFTGVCTLEFCTMRDELDQYNALNAEVIGISVDMLYTLAKWKEMEQLNFMLLSDFNKTVSRAYDSLIENWNFNMQGISKRAVFVIDTNGIIRHIEILANTGDMPNLPAIKAVLKTLA